MLKIVVMIFCLLFTFHGEYVEKRKLDKEKGLTESSKATLEVKWKR
jgi:hypothetical protein